MDLGAQEEFTDNFWCFWKMRCSTLYFSASDMYIFRFGGSVRPKPSLTNPKTGQNELKRLNIASAEGLRCLGGPADPPIDMSCLWTRSELFGMGNLAVTSVWQMCAKLFVTHLSHIGHIGFRPSWGEESSKTKLYDRNRYYAHTMCCLDLVPVALRSNTTAKCVTNSLAQFGTHLAHRI